MPKPLGRPPSLPPLTCRVCWTTYTWPPSRRIGERQHYCSRECFDADAARRSTTWLWDRLDKRGGPDACWLWTMGVDHDGYGVYGKPQQRAHREAYRLTYGEPSGHVLHHCDVRRCCNPRHLYAGTNGQNTQDRVDRDRSAKGARNTNTKLTEAQVAAIRSRYASGGVSQQALADEYGVSQHVVHLVIRRKTWRHVP